MDYVRMMPGEVRELPPESVACAQENSSHKFKKGAPILQTQLPERMWRFALTDAQIKKFDHDGYLLAKGLIDPARIRVLDESSRKLHEEIKQFLMGLSSDQLKPGARIEYKGASVLVSGAQSCPGVHLVSWAGAADPVLLDIGRAPELLVPMVQLLGSYEMDHIINQLHPKEKGDGVKFDLHQDYQNRVRFDPQWTDVNGRGSFIQTLTAIDASTPDNGPLKMIPMNGDQTFYDLKSKTDVEREELVDRLLRERGLEEAITVVLEPGDVVFFHPLLLHYSEPNTKLPFRRVLVSSCSYPGANRMPYPGKGSGERINVEDLVDQCGRPSNKRRCVQDAESVRSATGSAV